MSKVSSSFGRVSRRAEVAIGLAVVVIATTLFPLNPAPVGATSTPVQYDGVPNPDGYSAECNITFDEDRAQIHFACQYGHIRHYGPGGLVYDFEYLQTDGTWARTATTWESMEFWRNVILATGGGKIAGYVSAGRWMTDHSWGGGTPQRPYRIRPLEPAENDCAIIDVWWDTGTAIFQDGPARCTFQGNGSFPDYPPDYFPNGSPGGPQPLYRLPMELVGSRPWQSNVADPVDTASGNFWHVDEDLPAQNGAFGMDWRRTYNSRSGWHHEWSEQLTVMDDGTLALTKADGRLVLFPVEMNGKVGRPADEQVTASRLADDSWELQWDTGEAWTFTSSGSIFRKTNWDGSWAEATRDDWGDLLAVTCSSGESLAMAYSGGTLRTVTASDGRVATYGRSGSQQTATTPHKGRTTYATDGSGRVLSITDATGVNVVSNTYDSQGRVVQQIVGDATSPTLFSYEDIAGTTRVSDTETAQELIYRHDTHGRLTSVTDPTSATRSQRYDGDGNLSGSTDRRGGTDAAVFDDRGNITSATDENGITRSATFDAQNRMTSMTDPATGTETYTYIGNDRLPSSVVDVTGATTTFELAGGLITRTTDPDGVAMEYSYDGHRRRIAETIAPGTSVEATTTYTYDAAGRTLTTTDPLGNVTAKAYDGSGRLVSETDPLGNITSFEYDAVGRLLATTDPTGAVSRRTYDTSGRLASETSPRGLTTTYSYDALGQHVSTTHPDGTTTETSEYGPLERVTTATDGLGRATSYDYDAEGNVVAVTDPTSGVTSTDYDATGRAIATTDALGRTSSATTYDSAGRVSTVTELGGATHHYGYDAVGRPSTVTDARGGVTTTTYTPGGRVASVTDAAGITTTYAYDAAGRAITETGPAGSMQRRFDLAGREVETITPGGLHTHRSFDAAGRLLSLTDPAGVSTTYTYTPSGEVATETRTGERPVSYTYDPDGNVESIVDTSTSTTHFGYDDRNRRITQTDVAGKTTHWTYDAAGQLASRTDPLGRSTTSTYDAAGRLETTTDPTGRSTTRSYDDAGQLTAVAYGDGSNVAYTYDSAGRIATATDAAGLTRFVHEAGGLLAGIALPDGRRTTYRYNHAGRRVAMTLPDGASYRYAYDAAGRLSTVTPGETLADTFTARTGSGVDTAKWIEESAGGTAAIHANALRLAVPVTSGAAIGVRSTAPTTTDGEVSFRFRFDSTDKGGRLRIRHRNHPDSYFVEVGNDLDTVSLRRVVSGATATLGTFDLPRSTDERTLRFRVEDDQLKVRIWDADEEEPSSWNLEVADGGITRPGSMRITWSAAAGSTGERTVAIDDVIYRDLTSPPNPVATYGYDADGNVVLEALPGGHRTWDWMSGQLRRLSQAVPGANQVTDLAYDTSGRLRWERTGDQARTYSYDQASQLRMVTPSTGRTTTYTYNGRGRRTSATTGTATATYNYDDAGQLLSSTAPDGTTSYAYDTAGRRTTETGPSGTVTYGYDSAGRLHTVEQGGRTHTRTYGADSTINAITSSSPGGTHTTRLDWDAAQGLPQLVNISDATNTNIIGGNHATAAMKLGTSTRALAVDAHRSIIATPNTADIARAEHYDAWGTPTGAIAYEPKLGYRGELTLGALVHLRARDYQPTTAGFTTTDPLEGVPGTPTIAHPYHYADNNPLNKTDPTGMRPGASPLASDPVASSPTPRLPSRKYGARPTIAFFRLPKPLSAPMPSGFGTVETSFFIKECIVLGNTKGDCRDFSSHAGPTNARVFISMNFDTGSGYVRVNPSCIELRGERCVDALPITWGSRPMGSLKNTQNWVSAAVSASSVSLNATFVDSFAKFTTGIAPAINGTLSVLHGRTAGSIGADYKGDPFPSVETYLRRPFRTPVQLIRRSESRLPLGMSPMCLLPGSERIGAC